MLKKKVLVFTSSTAQQALSLLYVSKNLKPYKPYGISCHENEEEQITAPQVKCAADVLDRGERVILLGRGFVFRVYSR
ncbi:hypothetical protein SUGI_0908740 [Cryptomeria japonica]|nr:hypothetical protein SUGI_0908740 [Cryptomeria japonica]